MIRPDPTALLPAMIDAVLDAGAVVMRGFTDEARSCAWKSDGSPVTQADADAERLIAARLGVAAPGVPIVAEEAVASGHVPPEQLDAFFLVDPLDGTREFVAGLFDFTVNVALVLNGAPLAGVVYAPAYRELFVGSAAGAFKARTSADGVPGPLLPIAARARPPKVIALVSRSHHAPETDAYLAGLAVEAVVPVGSSLKFCRIAEGAADLYPKHGRTMEWDTAAAQAVLEAAGGGVCALDGARLGYNKRGRAGVADFANPSFVASGRPVGAAAALPAASGARSR